MKTAAKPPAGLPAELVASTLFLLKRLGFAAKQRSLDEYEQTGLGPYHHAILVLLEESAPERVPQMLPGCQMTFPIA